MNTTTHLFLLPDCECNVPGSRLHAFQDTMGYLFLNQNKPFFLEVS